MIYFEHKLFKKLEPTQKLVNNQFSKEKKIFILTNKHVRSLKNDKR